MSLEPVFTREEGLLVPTAQALGPWDPGQLHGGPVAALVAGAMQDLAPDMQLARITFEFLGPVPAAPLSVEAEIVKPGGRLQLARGAVSAGGRTALTATATLLRRGEPLDLPDIAAWDDPLPLAAGPDDPALVRQDPALPTAFHTEGMTIRFAPGTGMDHEGAAQGWFRLQRDLVAGEPMHPVGRAVAAADFGNGASRVLPWDGWLFINCDLSVTLLRDPAGEWLLLDSVTRIDPAGIGWASSRIFDARGPVGFAQQTLYVARR